MLLKILVVEDDQDIRELAELALAFSSQHQVATAFDGSDALEKLKSFEPDIVLMDVEMPRMNGYEACRALRANPRYKDLPIVFLSAHGSYLPQQLTRELGTLGTIAKPFDIHTLSDVIEFYYKEWETSREKSGDEQQAGESTEQVTQNERPLETPASQRNNNSPREWDRN